MTENQIGKYEIRLTDQEFVITSVGSEDQEKVYVAGAARPAPKDGISYSEQENTQFNTMVTLALQLAFQHAPQEVEFSVETEDEDLVAIGQAVQAFLDQQK